MSGSPRDRDRDPIHSTSLGKAIAATLPDQAVVERLGGELEARTPNTITSVDDYMAELAKVRRVGYAVDNGENELDGRCVAVAIPGSPVPAALSLSAPSARFPMQEVADVAAALQDAARKIMPASDA